jgi:hypothetical protein
MSFITKTIQWLKGAVKTVETAIAGGAKVLKVDIAPIVVAITGGINTALESGLLGSIASVIESILPGLGHVPETLVEELKKHMPAIIAANLGIIGLPDNPTIDQVKDFEQKVMDAFSIHSDSSKFYTNFAADMYGIIQRFSADTTPKTFAEKVIMIESIFQAYKSDVLGPKALVASTPVTTLS